MRIAYLECFSGISGDMFLGALLDAGVPPEVFTRTVAALGVDARLEISRVDRSGISATKLDVIAAGEKELPREEFWEKESKAAEHSQAHSHGHAHSHNHEHAHGHADSHSYEHSHSHEHKHENAAGHSHSHRGLKEIRQIIHAAGISQSAKDRAIRIFEALGAAEAKIHNTDVEKIHFHEVGAIDAIVDIVCASVGAEALGVEKWICSPVNVGGGTVVCAHGTFPVPAPATLELLKHAPVYSGKIQKELTTPTGAAILNVLASRFSQFPSMRAQKVAYGAGTRNFNDFPNVLRLTLGEAAAPQESPVPVAREQLPFFVGEISVLEATIDDMTPQVFAYVMERLLLEGALDVWGTPVQMKKSRPGMLLTVLCSVENSERLMRLILAETTTLGVRIRRENRATLPRWHVKVSTKWGDVRMKLANLNGSISNYAPEYEDCRQIAKEQKVPLKTVMQEAIKVYLENTNG